MTQYPPRPDIPPAAFLRADRQGNVTISFHVVPNASRTQLCGLSGEPGYQALKLKLKAVPVDGKANAALIRWLADCLSVPASAITVVRGTGSRRKQLRVSASAALLAAWDVLTLADAPAKV